MIASDPEIRRMTRRQVAEHLGVSLRTIDRWLRLELIPHYKIGGKVFFDRDDLAVWKQKYRRGIL